MNNLKTEPNKYESLPLRELVEFSLGGDWGKNPDEKFEDFVKVKVVRGTEFATWWQNKAKTAALRQIKKSSLEKRQLKAGDLIVEVSGGGPNQPVGRVVVIDSEAIKNSDYPLVCSNFFRQIRLKSDYTSEFVRLAILFNYLIGGLDKYQTSSTNLRNLNFNEFLDNVEIPALPKAEQEQVASTLSTSIRAGNLTKIKLGKAKKLVAKFRQAIISAAISGNLTEDWREQNGVYNWEDTTLESVIREKPRNGYSPKPVSYPTNVKSLTLSATTSGIFNPQHFKYIDEKIPQDSHLWLKPGDILIQRANSHELVGTSAIYDGKENEFMYPDLMMKIKPNERAIGEFIYYVLSSLQTKTYFRNNATGTAGNMPKINQGIVMNTPLSLPSIEEQKEIVKRVKGYLSMARKIEQQIEKAEGDVGKLTKAILEKTFNQ